MIVPFLQKNLKNYIMKVNKTVDYITVLVANKAVKAKQIENIKNVMESFQVSVYKAMESLKIPTEMYDFYIKKLNV